MTTTSATSSTATPATTSTTSSSAPNGSAILTALGAGSGIDTTTLVSQLVSASYDPKVSAITDQQTANTAKISTLGTLTSGIDAFASALQSLVAGGTLKSQPSTSDSSILTATTQAGTNLSALSAQIEVRQLATAQSLVSTTLLTAATPVGEGSLTLKVGTGTSAPTFNIAITAANNTMSGLAAAINATNTGATPSGVTATVVTDSSGARLVIKGQTGAANSFSLAANDDASTDLTRFASTGAGEQMTQAQPAQDAIVRMDGVDSSHSSNSIGDLIPGVTLNLVSAKVGTTVNLGLTRPTDAITQAVGDYVSAYNSLKAELSAATAVGSGGTGQGPLYGNAAIRQMQTQLSKITSTALSSYPNGPQTLAEIGVSTGQDGTLTVDSTKLATALATYPDAVEAMFNPTQRSDNPLIKVTSAIGNTKPGTYTVSSIVLGPPVGGKLGVGVDQTSFLPSSTDPSGLVASITSVAPGLAIQVLGNVGTATITIDAGLSGILQGIRDSLRATGGVLDSLSASLTNQTKSLADAQTKLQTQESAYKDQLTDQFSTMNTRVASYKSIQSYMTQQIAAWSKSD
ncbi:MAG TPA: flagellar filament capping protein FliD [Sphingomonas sp.]|uniref:flagellar filament capping protein FliD n=1 Tax=Sphingomonas sp. TaxID=28214 RepID=UPI002D066C00|nr:flagellar filament capping protein FliD [Sphingomonas sp.]HMI20736.1 flagellar filament capping protein FliD [Sphingomonas sp.]